MTIRIRAGGNRLKQGSCLTEGYLTSAVGVCRGDLEEEEEGGAATGVMVCAGEDA